MERDLYDAHPATQVVARVELPRPSWQAGLWRIALPVAAALAVTAVAVRFLAEQDSPAPLSLAAAPGALAADTPCLVDPRGLGPGYGVVAPHELCRNVVAPMGPGSTP